MTTGIYGVIRHPSYPGLLVMMPGWALLYRSGVGVMLVLLTTFPIVAHSGRREAPLAQFVSEYDVKFSLRLRWAPLCGRS